MEQSYSWEANSSSASQEIRRILWKPKVHYSYHKSLTLFRVLSQRISLSPRQLWTFLNKGSVYGEELLAPRPTPKLEDHAVSTVRDCLFNISAATLHIGGRSSIRNLRTRHAVVKSDIGLHENTSRNSKFG